MRNELLTAAISGDLTIIKKCHEQGIPLDTVDGHGRTALIEAAMRSYFEVVAYLLKNSANIHHKDNDGNSALFYTIVANQEKMAHYLLEMGAEIHQDCDVNVLLEAFGDEEIKLIDKKVEMLGPN